MTIQVREALVDAAPDEWLAEVNRGLSSADAGLVARAFALARECYGERLRRDGAPLLGHCREVAGILCELRMEGESLAAALLGAMPEVDAGWPAHVGERIGVPVAALIEGVARMAQIQGLRAKVEGGSTPAQRAGQLEALRKMLLAMVQDARVVLIKLADQTQTLRYLAGRGEPAARAAAARDTIDLFAPLANRLGVWQLKWELEDLALRCLDPEAYKAIARELHEKRPEREAYIAEVAQHLKRELAAGGVCAEVIGRPKHIYSIYHKLKRKDLTLKELFDVRGVRVLVDDVKDCYAALGLVHSLWTPLPKEFDDYIAKPKPNHYRSLHTAVVGPDGKVLEVQIRTHEMHRHNEYGVAAHWRYKEGGGSRADEARPRGESRRSAASFEERVGWLRQILEWRDGLADVADLAEYFRTGLFEDTVYVLTPQGRVIDLPQGATPVDFAYHVHSDLGHRCRGARVDGEMVPLDTRLANGQTVEIVAAKSGGPSRDWLNPELGYIHSSRARAKVRQWFNTQNLEAAVGQGRQIVERVLQRAGMTALSLDKLAAELQFVRVEDLLAAVGRNELTARQIQAALQAPVAAPAMEPVPLPVKPAASQGKGDILVVGVDKLLTVLARCCKPAPPDPIVGFVTRGRGVTVHRASCSNVSQLSRERLIEAQWGAQARGVFPVDMEVDGGSQPELMRDVLDVFAREQVRVLAARSHTRDARARLHFTIEIGDLSQLRRLLSLVGELPAVTQARRA